MDIIGVMEMAEKAVETGKEVAETVEKAAEITEKTVEAADKGIKDSALEVTKTDVDGLIKKAIDVERSKSESDIPFTGVKICATRHGCTGATNCDHAYGSPVGR